MKTFVFLFLSLSICLKSEAKDSIEVRLKLIAKIDEQKAPCMALTISVINHSSSDIYIPGLEGPIAQYLMLYKNVDSGWQRISIWSKQQILQVQKNDSSLHTKSDSYESELLFTEKDGTITNKKIYIKSLPATDKMLPGSKVKPDKGMYGGNAITQKVYNTAFQWQKQDSIFKSIVSKNAQFREATKGQFNKSIFIKANEEIKNYEVINLSPFFTTEAEYKITFSPMFFSLSENFPPEAGSYKKILLASISESTIYFSTISNIKH